MLLLTSVALASPPSVTVVYTARFDLDAAGDQMCAMTKLCDCTATYRGSGSEVHRDDGRVTFEGTWKAAPSDCHEVFGIWVPSDGEAFHTLRWSGPTLTEWVVHDDAAGHTRLASGMKAAGQFWIDELGHAWPADKVVVEQSDGSDLGGMMKVKVDHKLEITVE